MAPKTVLDDDFPLTSSHLSPVCGHAETDMKGHLREAHISDRFSRFNITKAPCTSSRKLIAASKALIHKLDTQNRRLYGLYWMLPSLASCLKEQAGLPTQRVGGEAYSRLSTLLLGRPRACNSKSYHNCRELV